MSVILQGGGGNLQHLLEQLTRLYHQPANVLNATPSLPHSAITSLHPSTVPLGKGCVMGQVSQSAV